MKYFKPISPDPALKKRKGDGALARFGHLNIIVDKLNELDANQAIAGGPALSPTQLILGFNLVTPTLGNDTVVLPCNVCACDGCPPLGDVVVKNNGLVNLTVVACGTNLINGAITALTILPGDSIDIISTSCTTWESVSSAAGAPGPVTGVQSVTDGCGVNHLPVLGVVTLDPIVVAPVSPTEALTGDGCVADPLSVCIDGTTITKDVNGCLQALGGAPAAGVFADFFGLTAGTGNPTTTDYAATIPASTGVGNQGVPFPRIAATSGTFTQPVYGTGLLDAVQIPAIGTYYVEYRVHTTEFGELGIEFSLDLGATWASWNIPGVGDPTTAANANPTSGGHPLIGMSYITTTAINTWIRVANIASGAPALTITPAAGTPIPHAIAQHIIIEKLA